jgi:predicted ATP-dependent endonuclease of OLD family
MKLSGLRVVNYKCFADSGIVELGPINVLIGRNNAGKSTLIHATHLVQQGAAYSTNDIRLGADYSEVTYYLTDVSSMVVELAGAVEVGAVVEAAIQINPKSPPHHLAATMGPSSTNFPYIHANEPENFIYTYLSKRKVTTFDQVVNLNKARAVSNNLEYIVAKVDRLANLDHPNEQEYTQLCKSVLGFRVSSFASPSGHQAGILVGKDNHIPIEDMGEGVSSLLGLITDLCVADKKLFLVEELENDIHPEGLKAMMQVIMEKSSNNQFIISTHSNIVMKYLGSKEGAKVFNVELAYQRGTVPTSTVHEVGSNREARTQVLQQLGYELYDFDLWEGWLILEESSAEVIIRDYLIPWFAPKLSRVRTIGAGGTSKIEPLFDDFYRLFLFTHLQPQYQGKAWVVADGDEPGREVVQRLTEKYGSWSPDHFRTWSESDFERYYPARFVGAADAALSKSGKDKREAKKALLDRVKLFCDEDDEAKSAFADSASEVVDFLQEIEEFLFNRDVEETL